MKNERGFALVSVPVIGNVLSWLGFAVCRIAATPPEVLQNGAEHLCKAINWILGKPTV